MSKVKVAGNPEIDPTLPKIAIKLGKETFYLCFTFKALALAQKNLRDIGIEVNLLMALDLSTMDALKLVPLFYAALITHQPKITIDKVTELVTLKNLGTIFETIAQAYGASLADPTPEDDKTDPDQPVV
ncbi:hypothetical protein [Granulicella sp. dw_53]|uniref:hypothetical protein n=1 Tax=Granulicella sp. dw_53 TaxID=2719792 RepID=UPI001BD653EF|nr:hypothetical protein [Granulicella sp. dw_53]